MFTVVLIAGLAWVNIATAILLMVFDMKRTNLTIESTSKRFLFVALWPVVLWSNRQYLTRRTHESRCIGEFATSVCDCRTPEHKTV